MIQNAAHKVVGRFRQTAVVIVILKQIVDSLRVPQTQMVVGTAASQMIKGFGHERRQQSALFGDRLYHPAKERLPVGRSQGVRIAPVNLELTVGIFVIVGVRIPAELLHVANQRRHHIQIAIQRNQVVTRLFEDIQIIAGDVIAVFALSQQHKFSLNTHF